MRDLGNITLLELLPPSISGDLDIIAAAKSIDVELRKVTESIDNVAIIHNLVKRKITDPALLSILADQFHVDFWDEDLPLKAKQDLVVTWLDMHTRKGTPSAVEDIIKIVFADADVVEWYEYGGRPYCFVVLVRKDLDAMEVTPDDTKGVVTAIQTVKNTRSWLEYIRYEFKPVRFVNTETFSLVNLTIHLAVQEGSARVKGAIFNGANKFDGSFTWESSYQGLGFPKMTINGLRVKQEYNFSGKVTLDTRWYFDGTYKFDGEKTFNADVKEVDL